MQRGSHGIVSRLRLFYLHRLLTNIALIFLTAQVLCLNFKVGILTFLIKSLLALVSARNVSLCLFVECMYFYLFWGASEYVLLGRYIVF